MLYASYKGTRTLVTRGLERCPVHTSAVRQLQRNQKDHLASCFLPEVVVRLFKLFFTRKDHRYTLVTEFALAASEKRSSTRQFCSQHVQHLTEVQSAIRLGYFTFDKRTSGQLCYLHHAWQNCFWSSLLATSRLSELLPVISVSYITLIRISSAHLC